MKLVVNIPDIRCLEWSQNEELIVLGQPFEKNHDVEYIV